ncbi:MAG: hypothetical protein IT301_08170 [Dehalococcoidia bacterium]|nr:hypothetical protein [Dehalococcoidia bacterium]
MPACRLQPDHIHPDGFRRGRVAPAFPLQRCDLGPDTAELLADDLLIDLSQREQVYQPTLALLELRQRSARPVVVLHRRRAGGTGSVGEDPRRLGQNCAHRIPEVCLHLLG